MEEVYHSKIEKEFAEYLIEIGYPSDSIVYEPAILSSDYNRSYTPDFLIVDPIKGEGLALIEIKAARLKDAQKTFEQLLAYRNVVGSNVPVFLVIPSESNGSKCAFDLYTFDENKGLITSDISLFPSFRALTAEQSAKIKSDIRSKKIKATELFQNVSWLLAFILAVIVTADFILAQYNIVLLTTERMALIGASVALIVIPFAQRFKGLGIEWERATKQDKSS